MFSARDFKLFSHAYYFPSWRAAYSDQTSCFQPFDAKDSEEPVDHTFTTLVVGESGVGKTAFPSLDRFTNDWFGDHCGPTIGVDFKIKTVRY